MHLNLAHGIHSSGSAVTHGALRELALATSLTSFPATPPNSHSHPSLPSPLTQAGSAGSGSCPYCLPRKRPHTFAELACQGPRCLRPRPRLSPDTFSSSTLLCVPHNLHPCVCSHLCLGVF